MALMRSASRIFGVTSRNISSEIAPWRRMTSCVPVQSTTVDSSPTSDDPPFRMQAIRPSISSRTAIQVVGLGRPERFAEGAATGT